MNELEMWEKLMMLTKAMLTNFQNLKNDGDFSREIPEFQKKAYAVIVPLIDLAKEVETVYFRKKAEAVKDGEVSLREK